MNIHELIRQHRAQLGMSQEDLARELRVTRATIQHWERDPPKGLAPARKRLDEVSRILKIDSQQLLSAWMEQAPKQVASANLGLSSVTVPPRSISWGRLGMEKLPRVFSTVLEDNAMADRAPAGTKIEFTRDMEPKPGDGVLVKDRAGNYYFREYRETTPGTWEAHADNEAYGPLKSTEHGLSVIAVLTGMALRWAK